jgi:hypothetical protein
MLRGAPVRDRRDVLRRPVREHGHGRDELRHVRPRVPRRSGLRDGALPRLCTGLRHLRRSVREPPDRQQPLRRVRHRLPERHGVLGRHVLRAVRRVQHSLLRVHGVRRLARRLRAPDVLLSPAAGVRRSRRALQRAGGLLHGSVRGWNVPVRAARNRDDDRHDRGASTLLLLGRLVGVVLQRDVHVARARGSPPSTRSSRRRRAPRAVQSRPVFVRADERDGVVSRARRPWRRTLLYVGFIRDGAGSRAARRF